MPNFPAPYTCLHETHAEAERYPSLSDASENRGPRGNPRRSTLILRSTLTTSIPKRFARAIVLTPRHHCWDIKCLRGKNEAGDFRCRYNPSPTIRWRKLQKSVGYHKYSLGLSAMGYQKPSVCLGVRLTSF